MLFLTGSDQENEKALKKYWDAAKTYATHVGHAYLEFLGPLMLLVAVNMAVDAHDNERFGLGWLYTTALKDDRVREEKFPAHEPGTIAQQRRSDAAKAVEYVASSV